jgi:hypothetical protein
MNGRAVGVVWRWKRTRWRSGGSGSCEMDVKARPTGSKSSEAVSVREKGPWMDGRAGQFFFCFVFWVEGDLGGSVQKMFLLRVRPNLITVAIIF